VGRASRAWLSFVCNWPQEAGSETMNPLTRFLAHAPQGGQKPVKPKVA